jgi:AcrR family transcriptional regulator
VPPDASVDPTNGSIAARAAAPTRRERQRQATFDEIVTTARTLLREHDTIALRAVAHEMGMTAPALYRYVDSHDQLLQLVARAIFDDIVAALAAAASEHPSEDPGAQLVTAAVEFRRWALTHPQEFGLLFANPAMAHRKGPDDAGQVFATFFAELYERVWKRYEFPVPAPSELPDDVARLLEAAQLADALPCDFLGAPIGLSWVFMRAWSRLYGIVALEIFGHLSEELVANGAMFRAMMHDNGLDLGLGDDLGRLMDVIDARLAAGVTSGAGR